MERAKDGGGSHGDAHRVVRGRGERRRGALGRRWFGGADGQRARGRTRMDRVASFGNFGRARGLGRAGRVRAGDRSARVGRRRPRVVARRSHHVEREGPGGGGGGGGDAERDEGVAGRRRAGESVGSRGRSGGGRVARVGFGRRGDAGVAPGASRRARDGRGGRRIRRGGGLNEIQRSFISRRRHFFKRYLPCRLYKRLTASQGDPAHHPHAVLLKGRDAAPRGVEHSVPAVPVDGHRRVERRLKLPILQCNTRPLEKFAELLLRQHTLQVRLHHPPVRAVPGVHQHPRTRFVPVVDRVRQSLGHRVLGAEVGADARDAKHAVGARQRRRVKLVPLEPHALADGGIGRLLLLGVVALDERAGVGLGGRVLPTRGGSVGEPLRDVPLARAQSPNPTELVARRRLEILRRLVHDGGGEGLLGLVPQRVERLRDALQHHVVLLASERSRPVKRFGGVASVPLFPRRVVAVGLDVHPVRFAVLLVAGRPLGREHQVLHDGGRGRHGPGLSEAGSVELVRDLVPPDEGFAERLPPGGRVDILGALQPPLVQLAPRVGGHHVRGGLAQHRLDAEGHRRDGIVRRSGVHHPPSGLVQGAPSKLLDLVRGGGPGFGLDAAERGLGSDGV
mmetsp:Transcript_11702/g.49071  ORF Transcript_11702/g.49071 Transcript_11702/m.49071 type:complete len:621 (+) Transcript_11702:1215-3077(+)